jgi:VWFA-related protein
MSIMMKLATLFLGAALLLAPPLGAQTQDELPPAPTPAQPRFPGAPAQPPKQQTQQQQPPAASAPSSNATVLTTLPPAKPTEAPPDDAQTAPRSQSGKHISDPSELLPAVSAQQEGNSQAQQNNAPADESGLFRIGVEVDLVDLIFTAVDKHGHFIKDLKREDVRLLDEGKPPERIEAFESQTGLPLRVGLLIDASNSIRDRFRFEQDAAVEFLHQVVRPGSDRAFVIGFDSLSDLTADYTDNTETLARGVRVLRPGGGTALHDAVFQACEKLAKAPTRSAVRRVIILLSDGDDNQSRHTREEAVEAALRGEVIIYVISTNISDSDKHGDKVLMRYAEATGGKVFFPLQLSEVSNDFAEIQDELRSQYVLAYKPQNFASDGRYRSISLTTPSRQNVKIRARKGYYAPTTKK